MIHLQSDFNLISFQRKQLGGGFNYFLFSPLVGEDEPILIHMFQRGWNHQQKQQHWSYSLLHHWNLALALVVISTSMFVKKTNHPPLQHPQPSIPPPQVVVLLWALVSVWWMQFEFLLIQHIIGILLGHLEPWFLSNRSATWGSSRWCVFVWVFFMFTSKIGEDEPILINTFQMGWNHQLVIHLPSSNLTWRLLANPTCSTGNTSSIPLTSMCNLFASR